MATNKPVLNKPNPNDTDNVKKEPAEDEDKVKTVTGHPFACKTCGKGFQEAYALISHEKIHNGDSEETKLERR